MLGPPRPRVPQILEQLVELLEAAYRRDDGLTIALSASGTSGMEAGLASLAEPGETVIVAACRLLRQPHRRDRRPPRRERGRGARRRSARPCPTSGSWRRWRSTPRRGWSRSSTPRRRPACATRWSELAEAMRGSRRAADGRLRDLAGRHRAGGRGLGRRLLLLVQPEVPGRASRHLAGVAVGAGDGADRAGARTPVPFSFDFELLASTGSTGRRSTTTRRPTCSTTRCTRALRLALEEGLEARWARHAEAGAHLQAGLARPRLRAAGRAASCSSPQLSAVMRARGRRRQGGPDAAAARAQHRGGRWARARRARRSGASA